MEKEDDFLDEIIENEKVSRYNYLKVYFGDLFVSSESIGKILGNVKMI
ncbi:hypothetical protein [Deferribacter autotrophicus]|nr:hypothetical protein [Deferribacter autotrophicus]